MATGIPLPGQPINSLMTGVNTGSSMFARLMQPIIERQKMAQQAEQFKQEIALRKAAAARAGANSDIQRQVLQEQLLGLKHKNDPNWELQQQLNAMKAFGMGGGSASPHPAPQEAFGEGQGMFSPEGLQDAQQVPEASAGGMNDFNPEMFKQNPLLRGFFKKKFGQDPLAAVPETPEQKRDLDFQSKVKLENLKTDNKTKALEDKEILAVKKDLPTLEKSLAGVRELKRIANANPSMFGHGFMPDRYAKTTNIKDFGKWQNLLGDAIAGLEQKLSSKGNIVALKMAAQLKPSHAEQQNVAIGKLESMENQLIEAIKQSKGKIGKTMPPSEDASGQYNENDMVIVEGPNGEETMTYAQAKALGAK